MKIRYKVKSVTRIGDQIKIMMQVDNAVEEKETFNPFDDMQKGEGLDLGGIMQKAQNMAVKFSNQDSITVPHEEWEKNKFNVDDIIVLDISKEK